MKEHLIHQPLHYSSNFEPSELAQQILRDGKITASEETPKQMIERMVLALFEPEKRFGTPQSKIQEMMNEFGWFLDNKYAVMSTPVMNNAGRYQNKPLSACTVPPVDLRGDLGQVKRTIDNFHQDGMGTGFNLNETDDPVGTLRFLNEVAVEGAKSGLEDRPVGNMAILSIHHPKILEFADVKVGADERGEEWKFNISIDASDEFMQAVNENTTYQLLDGTELNAKEVMLKIVTNATLCGDPGLIFIDRMNRDNPTPGVGVYTSTAPCAEVGLTPGESCQFGYINLAQFIEGGEINMALLEKMTRLMTRVLDNALEASIEHYKHPLNQKVMNAKRKIGVGICGLADLFLKLQIPYDSSEARRLSSDLIAFVNYFSKVESHELAKTRGSFGAMDLVVGNRYRNNPGFIEDKYGQLSTTYVTSEMWQELGATIRQLRFLRNASTIALPPTGRSGLVIDASTGVEPVFSLINYDGSINQTLLEVLEENGLSNIALIEEIKQTGKIGHLTQIPENIRKIFQTALEITPDGHLAMVSGIQETVDESIAKTINMPNHSTPEDVMDIYLRAYNSGLKGITIYRTGSRTVQPRKLAKE
jgi:ribonucleoside-diphosphate reductase alpha chain